MSEQDELLLTQSIQRLFCQHCKALQKTNKTVVECWYNPLDDEKEVAFCAANEDAVNEILAKAKQHYIEELGSTFKRIEEAKHKERERIKVSLIEHGNIIDLPTKRKRSLLILLSEFHKALKGGKNNDNKNSS